MEIFGSKIQYSVTELDQYITWTFLVPQRSNAKLSIVHPQNSEGNYTFPWPMLFDSHRGIRQYSLAVFW